MHGREQGSPCRSETKAVREAGGGGGGGGGGVAAKQLTARRLAWV